MFPLNSSLWAPESREHFSHSQHLTEAGASQELREHLSPQTERVYPFYFRDQSNQAKATLSRKPGMWCCPEHLKDPPRHPPLNLPLGNKSETCVHGSAAEFITCKVFFLSSSVNIIKASAYYRFHCPPCWSLLTVQIRLLNVNMSEVKAGRRYRKGLIGKSLSTKESSEICRAWGLHTVLSPKSRSGTAVATNAADFSPLTQKSPPNPRGNNTLQKGALWSCMSQQPQIACDWKTLNTCNTRLLSL